MARTLSNRVVTYLIFTDTLRISSSVTHLPSSVFLIRHTSCVIRHPSSVIRHPSSVIRHPPSAIRQWRHFQYRLVGGEGKSRTANSLDPAAALLCADPFAPGREGNFQLNTFPSAHRLAAPLHRRLALPSRFLPVSTPVTLTCAPLTRYITIHHPSTCTHSHHAPIHIPHTSTPCTRHSSIVEREGAGTGSTQRR